jgi:hypothetical protein
MKTTIIYTLLIIVSLNAALGSGTTFEVRGNKTYLNGKPTIFVGLRCSNALLSEQTTEDLIAFLPEYKRYGLNIVSVFLMGSRYGDVIGFNEDATLNQVYSNRLEKIIQAADELEMVILVGVLYWGDSKSKWDAWGQKEAEKAVYNTVKWLSSRGYKNVFIDVDNEGMGQKFKDFDQEGLVKSAKKADPAYFVATNFKGDPPVQADLGIHFSNKTESKPYIESEGTPDNAPGNYWGSYSKRPPLYNYINIGVYTDEMKQRQLEITKEHFEHGWGYMLASTWLQCVPPDGPHANPGGMGTIEDPGIRWWLEGVQKLMVEMGIN